MREEMWIVVGVVGVGVVVVGGDIIVIFVVIIKVINNDINQITATRLINNNPIHILYISRTSIFNL
jgi:hypothetical protein